MSVLPVEVEIIALPEEPTRWRRARRELAIFFKGKYTNVLAAVLVGLMIFLALFGKWLTPYSPITMNLGERLAAPSALHWFGTDDFGRDMLSRVMAGAGISLGVAALVLVIATVGGILVGCLAGLLGGWVDELLMRLTDLFMSFPAMVLAIAIAATLGPSLSHTMLALSTVYWPWYARLVRGQVLSLREREYILASTALGSNLPALVFRHLLPNLFPILITQVSLDVGYAVLSTAGLSFLGLGAQPPTPEWGAIIFNSRIFMRESWWFAVFPGLALSLTVLGFNLLGDGLRDHLDPRLRD